MNQNQFNTVMQGWLDTQRKKEIVFVDNGRIVTDSLTVAEVFDKEHARVMRDIRDLQCSDSFRVGNFAESTYINGQGREMPKYLITEQGFTLLAMGYTGQRAMEFKERYISEFDRMRQQLQNGVPSLSPNQAMAIALQQTAEMMTKVPVLESRIGNLENTMTIDYGQQRSLRKLGNEVVMDLVGGKNSVAYKKFASKAFNELWKHYKNTFNIESYCNTPALEYERGKEVLKAWKPSEELRYAILGANTEQLVSN